MELDDVHKILATFDEIREALKSGKKVAPPQEWRGARSGLGDDWRQVLRRG